jgi:hypothetical protein
MAASNDFMQYKNVVSRACLIPADRFVGATNAFFADIAEAGLTISSLPFLIVLPQENGELYVKYHISVEEESPDLPEGLAFDSYFGIDDMASVTFCGDIAENSETVVKELYGHLDRSGFMACTPLYAVLHNDGGFQYVSYKIGYCPKNLFEW